jgi:hypothetical protein
MKKTVVPASFLSVVLPAVPNQTDAGQQTDLLSETKRAAKEKASRLYQILFDKQVSAQKIQTGLTSSEPDYFSSYE